MSDNLEFYEAFAPYYEAYYAGLDPDATVRSWQPLLPAGRAGSPALIDLGCGPGRHLRPWQRQGFAVSGLDGSPAMLERAAGYAGAGPGTDIALYCADLSQPASLRPLAGQFDIAVAHFNFLNLIAPGKLPEVFAGISALLRPGGVFVTDYTVTPPPRIAAEIELIAPGCTRRSGEITSEGAAVEWTVDGRSYVEYYWFHPLAALAQAAQPTRLTRQAAAAGELLVFRWPVQPSD